jgi:HK97 family phage prohead protease
MTTWFRRESEIVRGSIQIAREHLAANPDDHETRASLAELERQRDDLYRGWENSSLRRAVESAGADRLAGSGSEQRVGLAIADGPAAVRNDRAASTSSTTTAKSLVGYAAVFNRWATIGGYFKEQIAPGAFAEALKKSDVRCLFNHDSNFIYGRTSASTLELGEDAIGLRFVCYLLAFDAQSYSLARRIDRRDLSGCSFSFTVEEDKWRLAPKAGDLDERTILKIGQLYDVGPVTYPAYPQTSVQALFEKVDTGRTAPLPAHDDDLDAEIPVERPQPGGRPIPAWRQRALDLRLKHIEDELHNWRVEHVKDDLDDLDRWRSVQKKRLAHLARHPEDKDRIDIPGGLLFAGRG